MCDSTVVEHSCFGIEEEEGRGIQCLWKEHEKILVEKAAIFGWKKVGPFLSRNITAYSRVYYVLYNCRFFFKKLLFPSIS
jgi:hypothetical protein